MRGSFSCSALAICMAVCIAAVCMTGCKGNGAQSNGAQGAGKAQEAVEERFWPFFSGNYPMALATDEARVEYFCRHSWDEFDFNDTLSLSCDTFNVLTQYAGYIQALNSLDGMKDGSAAGILSELYARASTSRTMMEWFAWQAREVLADPNSPIRDDMLFEQVLLRMLQTAFYTDAERARLEYKLDLMRKNRVGTVATDFIYTLDNGRQGRLYDIKANFTLVFFNNPGCPMCREVREELLASDLIASQPPSVLTILAMSPDFEPEEWSAYKDERPAEWINAYDRDGAIRGGQLYDVSAIPSLYLLDRNKNVLLKDVTEVSLIEQGITQAINGDRSFDIFPIK